MKTSLAKRMTVVFQTLGVCDESWFEKWGVHKKFLGRPDNKNRLFFLDINNICANSRKSALSTFLSFRPSECNPKVGTGVSVSSNFVWYSTWNFCNKLDRSLDLSFSDFQSWDHAKYLIVCELWQPTKNLF